MRVPLALTRRGWTFLLGAIGFWVAWKLTSLGEILYLIAFFASLVALSLLWTILFPWLAHIRVQLSGPYENPTVGDRVSFRATVQTRFLGLKDGQLHWKIAGQSRTPSDQRLSTPIDVRAFGTASSSISGVLHTRGVHQVRVYSLVITDPLGISRRRIQIKGTAEVLVLPRLLPSLPESLIRLYESIRPETSADTIIRNVDAETPSGALRGYRTGDPLRYIHWKQSARQGELLVNLLEGGDGNEISLMLVTEADTYNSNDEFETAVSVVATVATQLLRDDRTVLLHIGSAEMFRCTSEREVLRHLALAETTVHDDGSSGLGRYVSDVVVTGSASPGLTQVLIDTYFRGVLLVVQGDKVVLSHNSRPDGTTNV